MAREKQELCPKQAMCQILRRERKEHYLPFHTPPLHCCTAAAAAAAAAAAQWPLSTKQRETRRVSKTNSVS